MFGGGVRESSSLLVGAGTRGRSAPSGTFCRRRVPSTRTGTGIPHPHAWNAPGRKKMHPYTQNVPVSERGNRL